MRRTTILLALAFVACSKKSSAPKKEDKPAASHDAAVKAAAPDAAAAAPDAAPKPMSPPGFVENGPAPAEAPAGPRVVPPRKFRHSSVRGDFRIYVTKSGLVTSWHTLLSARTLDGAPAWKHDNLGRAVAVSPDGTRIVANNDAGDLKVLDAATGEPATPPTRLGGRDDPDSAGIYISAFAWTPDGQHIIAVDSKHVFVLKPDGTVDHELPVCADGNCFFSSAAAASNEEIILVDANAGLRRVKLADGAVVATGDYQGADAELSRDGKYALIDGNQQLALFDAATLAPVWTAAMPGAKGVAFAADAPYANVQFKSMPKLSPNGSFVAVNDQAGALWLLSAADGKPLVAYPDDVIGFVEDVTWLDDGTLLAIDNDGHVRRIAGTPAAVVWSQDDAPEPEQWDEPQ